MGDANPHDAAARRLAGALAGAVDAALEGTFGGFAQEVCEHAGPSADREQVSQVVAEVLDRLRLKAAPRGESFAALCTEHILSVPDGTFAEPLSVNPADLVGHLKVLEEAESRSQMGLPAAGACGGAPPPAAAAEEEKVLDQELAAAEEELARAVREGGQLGAEAAQLEERLAFARRAAAATRGQASQLASGLQELMTKAELLCDECAGAGAHEHDLGAPLPHKRARGPLAT